MKVNQTMAVDIALRTLDAQEREEVRAWFDKLKNWETDETVKTRSYRLNPESNVYVLHTYGDFRIFFTREGDFITIDDITTRAAILASGGVPK